MGSRFGRERVAGVGEVAEEVEEEDGGCEGEVEEEDFAVGEEAEEGGEVVGC